MPRIKETTATTLHDVLHQLVSLAKKVDKMHADIQAALDTQANALAAQGVEITRTQTLEAQNKALLEGLNAQIQTGGNPAEIAAAIGTKTADIGAKTATLKTANDAIAADIVANTPPATP